MNSVYPSYKVVLRDQSYEIVAVFDSWSKLSFTKEVNAIGSYDFAIDMYDERADLFELDGILEIWRSVPGCDLDWYCEFVGLHRFSEYTVDESGISLFVSHGVGPNDLLARTIINYLEATIKSYKKVESETAMKEYVEENCGASATVLNERESNGVLPDFYVETDSGAGSVWEGDRAFDNLLDVLKDISKFAAIDFDTVWDPSSETFTFQTYEGQRGLDRTITGLSPSTGLNSAGNIPTVFSLELGNIRSLNKSFNRMSESNVVTVLGDGSGSTRKHQVRSAITSSDSPWNRREVSRSKSGFESEMQQYGDEVLQELSAKESMDFSPLMQSSTLYGRDYSVGDRVTIHFKGTDYSQRLNSVSVEITDEGEVLQCRFAVIS